MLALVSGGGGGYDALETILAEAGQPSRFNPYQSFLQQKARMLELSSLKTAAGNSHHTDYQKIRRNGVIENAIEMLPKLQEKSKTAHVESVARHISRPGV